MNIQKAMRISECWGIRNSDIDDFMVIDRINVRQSDIDEILAMRGKRQTTDRNNAVFNAAYRAGIKVEWVSFSTIRLKKGIYKVDSDIQRFIRGFDFDVLPASALKPCIVEIVATNTYRPEVTYGDPLLSKPVPISGVAYTI